MIKIHIPGGNNMKKQSKLDNVKGFKTLTKEEKRKTVGGASIFNNILTGIYDIIYRG